MNESPELKDIIKQVANCNEFKYIISNISDTLLNLNNQNINSNYNENNKEENNHKDTNTKEKNYNNESDTENSYDLSITSQDNENNLENCIAGYFLNKNGENICDCIDKLNYTVDKLNNNVEKLLKFNTNNI